MEVDQLFATLNSLVAQIHLLTHAQETPQAKFPFLWLFWLLPSQLLSIKELIIIYQQFIGIVIQINVS